MDAIPNYGWPAVLAAVLTLAGTVVKAVLDKRKARREGLDKLEEKIDETDDPSIAAIRRRRWWLRNRKS
jgi:heme exporter protein D